QELELSLKRVVEDGKDDKAHLSRLKTRNSELEDTLQLVEGLLREERDKVDRLEKAPGAQPLEREGSDVLAGRNEQLKEELLQAKRVAADVEQRLQLREQEAQSVVAGLKRNLQRSEEALAQCREQMEREAELWKSQITEVERDANENATKYIGNLAQLAEHREQLLKENK
ncbi:unnamed protein product, partial [Chrysoparadoxa australica]